MSERWTPSVAVVTAATATVVAVDDDVATITHVLSENGCWTATVTLSTRGGRAVLRYFR